MMHGAPYGAVRVQEIRLPDGRVFKVFAKCMVKIYVEKGANHREKLRMELLDSNELPAE